MSAAFDKEFAILLKTQADTAGLVATKTQLEATTVAAEETTVAFAGLGAELATAFSATVIGAILITLAEIPLQIAQAVNQVTKWNEEIAKQTQQVAEAVIKWNELASTADKFKDTVKLSALIASDLQTAESEMNAWRTKELGAWATFFDLVAKGFASLGGRNLGGTTGPFQAALDEAQAAARANAISEIQQQGAAIDRAAAGEANWKRQQDDLASGIPEVQARIDGLNVALQEQDQILKSIAAKGPAMTDADIHDANAATAERARLNQQLGISEGHLEKLNNLQDKQKEAKTDYSDLNAELREQALHLQEIRGLMAAIAADPFATVAQKAAAQFKLVQDAIKTVGTDIANDKAKLAGGALDPQHLEQVRGKLIADRLEMIRLVQEAQKLSTGGELKADLLAWANQFGSVIHQISGLLTDTLGSAINTVASGISGLIFGTQTLAQAALQFGEQFVSSLIRIGLQMLAQFLLGQALGEASAAAASAIATPIALAYAPAATLAATASYGGAAVAGQAAITEAVLSTQGLASLGGFERGGYTGPAGGIVHGNEYVIDSTSLSRAGGPAFFDNLRVALNQRGGPRGATSPGGGGPAGGGHHFYLFTDRESLHRHWQSNPTSKKTVIDWVNSAGGHLRT